MIARLQGTAVAVAEDHVVLDVNGVGYEVFVPTRTASATRPEAALTLHVHTAVREDAITLYGFATADDKACFRAFLSVNGIGGKLALAALSAHSADALARAVNENDLRTLSGISGVGKKTAERIVLELRGKLAFSAANIPTSAPRPAAPADPLPLALAQLGYKKSEIDLAQARLAESGLADAPLERRIKESLTILSVPR